MTRLTCLLVFIAASPALAHEGHEEVEVPKADFPSAMVLPAIEGPRPWSDKPLLNDPDRFQIAIMTDRTGGHRPGVWMDAVRKLNLLRPEFVVSVGDLIEGYTDDPRQADREWEEFLGFIDQLQMRFFFVAGNHDLTNPMLHRKWRERFGREWYSFDYRGVHFLCLCSEDPVQQHISQEQIEFVRKDLADHADARWTLVFLHKPLWTYAERGLANDGVDPTNWKEVERLLVDRPHTIFAGHVHHYVQYQRNGREYYSLATTGGGSLLRGNEYGEFDHVTWLTMEHDGPHVANLRLDGILRPDVVTEESAERFNRFLRMVTVEVAPILIDDESGFVEGELSVRLTNELGAMVTATGRVDGLPLRGLTVDPAEFKLAAGPVGTAEQTVRVRFDEPIAFDRLRRGTFTAKVQTVPEADGEAPLRAERTVPIVIDYRYLCPRAKEPLAIDGDLERWPEKTYGPGEEPLILGAAREWNGPQDADFRVATAHDDRFLYVRARVTDERVVAGEDRLTFVFDGRPSVQRDADRQLRRGTFVISVPAPAEGQGGEVAAGPGWRNRPIEGVKAAALRTESGYDLELAVPVERLARTQGGDWSDFQLSAVLRDVDDPARDAAEVVWRGTRSYKDSNMNFARFTRGD
ncbi:metallophosphoesterase [Botrimarina sp.]|uniref:metallophosphoesterase n=1 Tax=Botrimarina sp. TaxID=2795802 RepID=UPI0032ECFCDC